MEKKALKYLIILLVVPIIISVIIALATGKADGSNDNKNHYDSINGQYYHDTYTQEEEVKRSTPFIYLSVFVLMVAGVGVWVYLKKKESIW